MRVTPDILFVWHCHTCANVLGCIREDSVQIRYKGTIIEAVFPVLRLCHKCRTYNRIDGPAQSLTVVSLSDRLMTCTIQQTQSPRLSTVEST